MTNKHIGCVARRHDLVTDRSSFHLGWLQAGPASRWLGPAGWVDGWETSSVVCVRDMLSFHFSLAAGWAGFTLARPGWLGGKVGDIIIVVSCIMKGGKV